MTASRYNLLRVLDRISPEVRDAFIASIDDIKSSVQIQVVERHLRAGNIDSALEALNVRREFFGPLEEALAAAYRRGGAAALAGLPEITDESTGGRVVSRFDAANPRAESFLRTVAAGLVTAITQEQRDQLRAVLAEGVRQQLSARDIARTIVGYKNRATGRREGGVLGLDRQKLEWVLAAQTQLQSGDKKQMRAYLTRKRRDRRFDNEVLDAIKANRKLDAVQIRLLTARYARRLLQLRGMNVARTELIRSLHHAQDEGLQQLIERGALRPEQIKRTWDAAEDAATRPNHAAMDGQVRILGVPFQSPSGALLMFPGDTSPGAPPEEVINCRCVLRIDIDFIAGLPAAA